MLGDIAFDLLPIISVITDFLAVCANRQEALELLDPCEGLFEGFYAVRYAVL
jgi:hypothetical protein